MNMKAFKILGLLTGSAFPQGGAIINSHLPCRKKPEALQNAHLLCCAANRTAQRISIYASRFGYLRALHLNIFEQPSNMGYFNNPILSIIVDFPGSVKAVTLCAKTLLPIMDHV